MLVWMFRPNNHKKNPMHKPGIEPGSIAWQATILPLDHLCLQRFGLILIVLGVMENKTIYLVTSIK